jgi:hypothetical protein
LKALNFVAQLDVPGVFVFLDVELGLSDPRAVRQIKDIAERGKPGQTLILATPTSHIPAELSGLALPWRLHSPSIEELEEVVRRIIDELGARNLAVRLRSGVRPDNRGDPGRDAVDPSSVTHPRGGDRPASGLGGQRTLHV